MALCLHLKGGPYHLPLGCRVDYKYLDPRISSQAMHNSPLKPTGRARESGSPPGHWSPRRQQFHQTPSSADRLAFSGHGELRDAWDHRRGVRLPRPSAAAERRTAVRLPRAFRRSGWPPRARSIAVVARRKIRRLTARRRRARAARTASCSRRGTRRRARSSPSKSSRSRTRTSRCARRRCARSASSRCAAAAPGLRAPAVRTRGLGRQQRPLLMNRRLSPPLV